LALTIAWAAARVVKHDRPFLIVPQNKKLLALTRIKLTVSGVLGVGHDLSINDVKVISPDLIDRSRSIASAEDCDSISADDDKKNKEEDR
jgi:hypothetical protein